MLKTRATWNSLLGPLIYRVWDFESPTMLLRASVAGAVEASTKSPEHKKRSQGALFLFRQLKSDSRMPSTVIGPSYAYFGVFQRLYTSCK